MGRHGDPHAIGFMSSKIWEPLEQEAEQLGYGTITVEIVVRGRRAFKVRVLDRKKEWTEQDVLKKPGDLVA